MDNVSGTRFVLVLGVSGEVVLDIISVAVLRVGVVVGIDGSYLGVGYWSGDLGYGWGVGGVGGLGISTISGISGLVGGLGDESSASYGYYGSQDEEL